MDILNDQRKRAFTPIVLSRLANRARGGIGPERFVVGPTVVVAGKAEPGGCPNNQECWRPSKPFRPPTGFGSGQPSMSIRAEQHRRIKRRKVVAGVVMISLDASPGRVHEERT